MPAKRRPKKPPKLGLNVALVNDTAGEGQGHDEMAQSFNATFQTFETKPAGAKMGLKINSHGVEAMDSAGGKIETPNSATSVSGSGIELSDLKVIRELGRGASSYVQLVQSQRTEKLYALKVINVYDKAMRGMLMKEITTLFKCDCVALVTCGGCFYKEGKISVALEYMDMGSLDQVIAKYGPIPERVLAAMTFQVLWGLAYLKYEHRLHRDIKPQNILLNSDGQVKLTDFGIARELENSIGKAMTIVGTFKYMSPERILGEPYTYSSDVWSLGLVLLECATGKYPYSGINSMIEMAQTVTEAPSPTLPSDSAFSTEFREFVAQCLDKKAENRVPADVLLGSPWLRSSGTSTNAKAVSICHEWVQSVQEGKQEEEAASPKK